MELIQKSNNNGGLYFGSTPNNLPCFLCGKKKSVILVQVQIEVCICRECLKLFLGVIKKAHEEVKARKKNVEVCYKNEIEYLDKNLKGF